MEKNDQNRAPFQQGQQGSGSSENTGRDRTEQRNAHTELNKQERQEIAGEMGQGPNRIADLKDMGALSGRDDAAGGSGDEMENENTGKATER
ncbi:MAG: hypothetical protein ICV51_19700 [Flavisolibacter sp.]|nr:hypothetical protein [Flavisolibacter sp.]MBD0286880.1 hypothetical protein [Flavisolibacter sp.]MBD0295875.1 hypothetical protein [Flavisolibacter sp.]MBD0352722.1 hypothetical protein [Flavisolibacter sp.]MBD0368544.1 hypothetical protein [Flavisolibacter sp.]